MAPNWNTQRPPVPVSGSPGYEQFIVDVFNTRPDRDCCRPFDVENPRYGDDLRNAQLATVKHYFEYKDWENAARYLQHWLEAGGQSQMIDVAELLGDLEPFEQLIRDFVTSHRDDVRGYDSGWGTFAVEGMLDNANGDVLDWYYALNHFEYRIFGRGDSYTILVYKAYNFGGEGGGPGRSDLPYGPFEISQEHLADLHEVGYAQDFEIAGQYTNGGSG